MTQEAGCWSVGSFCHFCQIAKWQKQENRGKNGGFWWFWGYFAKWQNGKSGKKSDRLSLFGLQNARSHIPHVCMAEAPNKSFRHFRQTATWRKQRKWWKKGYFGGFYHFRQRGGLAELAELAETEASYSLFNRIVRLSNYAIYGS